VDSTCVSPTWLLFLQTFSASLAKFPRKGYVLRFAQLQTRIGGYAPLNPRWRCQLLSTLRSPPLHAQPHCFRCPPLVCTHFFPHFLFFFSLFCSPFFHFEWPFRLAQTVFPVDRASSFPFLFPFRFCFYLWLSVFFNPTVPCPKSSPRRDVALCPCKAVSPFLFHSCSLVRTQFLLCFSYFSFPLGPSSNLLLPF